jgi:prepilin-type N-terminal cleavage/methylation domain-containing protein
MKRQKGFTLVEILIVVIILGVITTFALPAYRNASRRASDREAQALLRLVSEAEEIYQSEFYQYRTCDATAGLTGCNSVLRLDLPLGGDWAYDCNSPGATYCCQATGGRGSGEWNITESDDLAQGCNCAGANCPP